MVRNRAIAVNDKDEIVTYNYLHPEDYETEEIEDGYGKASAQQPEMNRSQSAMSRQPSTMELANFLPQAMM